MSPADALQLAEKYLSGVLPRRWMHVCAVARAAGGLAGSVGLSDRDLLVSVAWLHDIGYAPGAADTGFHPLDGARFLKNLGVDGRVCGLVAFHSCAVFEAEERGLREALESEFSQEDSPVSDALLVADMTTGPDGQRCTIDERVDEVITRYGPDNPVSKGLGRARKELLAAAQRVEARLQNAAWASV